MSETEVARVYAEALFEAASDADALDAVRRDLEQFADAFGESQELQAFFLSEDLGDEEKKDLLLRLAAEGHPLVMNFLRVLVDKDREPLLNEIRDAFVTLVRTGEGLVPVEVTTARPLSESVAAEIKEALESSLDRPVEFTMLVDEDILGGVKLRVADKVADASLRHRLEALRTRLVSARASLEGTVEAAS